MPARHRDESVDPHAPQTPPFDWRAEESAQKRDLSRFAGEMSRAITMRGGSPSARQLSERVRERWDQLIRRLEGRWARGSEIWDRQTEQIERLSNERALLDALLTLDESLSAESDVDAMLGATLRILESTVPCDGALIHIAESGGQPQRRSTERRKGRVGSPGTELEFAL